MLSGLAKKKAVPFLIRNVAPEVVRMGKDVLGHVLEGRNLRQSLRTRSVSALKGVGKDLPGAGAGASVNVGETKSQPKK